MRKLSSILLVHCGRKTRLVGRILALLTAAVAVVYLWFGLSSLFGKSALQVHFIDVGHGDAILVSCEGQHMLIDAGLKKFGPMVCDYLRNQGVNKLSYIVCSHEHKDHVGGMLDVVQGFEYDVIMAPSTSHYKGSREFNKLMDEVHKHGKKVTIPKAGDVFSLGSAQVSVLGPVKPYGGKFGKDNHSLVLRVVYGDHSFLFTGDIYEEAELDIMERTNVRSDVLKVAHHGSCTSTGEAWLNAVNPKYAIVSDNKYHDVVIPRLERRGIANYLTARNGDITITCDKHNMSIKTSR